MCRMFPVCMRYVHSSVYWLLLLLRLLPPPPFRSNHRKSYQVYSSLRETVFQVDVKLSLVWELKRPRRGRLGGSRSAVRCRRRYSRRSQARFLRYSYDYTATTIGATRKVYSGTVGHLCRLWTTPNRTFDLWTNMRSRLIRGPVNPVKAGGPLATRVLDRQDLSFLWFMGACVFHKVYEVYDRYHTYVCTTLTFTWNLVSGVWYEL